MACSMACAKPDLREARKYIAKAIDWLNGANLHNPAWSIAWNILWTAHAAQRDELVKIAKVLLIEAPPKDPNPILHKLENNRTRGTASDRGRATDYRWKDAWEVRWNEAPFGSDQRSELTDRAKVWLSDFDFAQGGWSSVWKLLWDAAEGKTADRAYLMDLADRWLGLVDSSHPSWSSIWLLLWSDASADPTKKESLAAQGRKWLALSPWTNWHLVWAAIWSSPDHRDEIMRNIALSRLADLSPNDRLVIETLLSAR